MGEGGARIGRVPAGREDVAPALRIVDADLGGLDRTVADAAAAPIGAVGRGVVVIARRALGMLVAVRAVVGLGRPAHGGAEGEEPDQG